MHENAVPPQQHPEHYLCIPGPGSTSLLATILPKESADPGVQAKILDTDSEELETGVRVDETAIFNTPRLMRVFSRSLFVKTVR